MNKDIGLVKKRIKDLKDIQASNGNWNYSEYMRGLANGLILALSVIDNKEPIFLDAPERYLTNE